MLIVLVALILWMVTGFVVILLSPKERRRLHQTHLDSSSFQGEWLDWALTAATWPDIIFRQGWPWQQIRQ